MIFQSGKTYDVLVYIAQIVLPAFATLYGTLATIWGLPYGEQIVETVIAIDTCLGVLLRISKKRYDKSDPEYMNVLLQQSAREEAGEFDGQDYTGGEE